VKQQYVCVSWKCGHAAAPAAPSARAHNSGWRVSAAWRALLLSSVVLVRRIDAGAQQVHSIDQAAYRLHSMQT
jgi:hypothetical protein